jgi:Arc/MetJ-type ribon-helix-helix transcriptional regulator
MTIATTPALEQAIQRHMASGRYASEADVLEAAMRALARRDEVRAEYFADLKESLADEQAGRTHSLQEVDAEFRAQYTSLRNR